MARRGSILVAAALGALATMLVGGIAWAAIPGAGGVIQGCYKSNNGQLRVVDAASDCNPSELAINWNQQGPQGLQGPKGDKGDNGDQGIQGIQGPKGDQGIQGVQGPKGDQGIQGVKGDKGDQATQGIQGPKGDTGDTGPPGISGLQVVTGPPLVVGLFDFGHNEAVCPAGTTLIGGGGRMGFVGSDAGYLEQSYPSGNTWFVRGHNVGPFIDEPLVAYAFCANVS